MSQLNSPSLKGLLKHLESQGRASDFRTRKSIYDLKGLNKRLGPYRGAESQNFALRNIIIREDETDVRLMKSKGGGSHVFDVPGHSHYKGHADNPIDAQQNAVQKATVSTYTPYAPTGGNLANITGSLTGSYSVSPKSLLEKGYEARSGGLFHTSSGQMVPGINYNPSSSQILADPNALQAWLTSLGRTSTTQTPAEAAGQPPPQAGDFGVTPRPPQMTTDALGNQVPVGVTGVNPQGVNPLATNPNAPPPQVNQAANPPIPGAVSGATQPRTLIDIAQSRPDVLSTAQSQGGDPFTAGTPANTWLNDWWNREGPKEYPGVQLSQPGPPGAGQTQPEDFLAGGEQTPEGILAQQEAKMAKEAADRASKGETQSLQENLARAGLAFSGVRGAAEQDLKAAQFARKEGISLDLAKVILSAASAELKRQQGEIREIGNKLVRVKPDGTVETIYEDVSQLTPEQKLQLEFKFREKELELGRQSELEMERQLAAAKLGRYEPTKGPEGPASAQAPGIQERLIATRGSDGYVDPNSYANERVNAKMGPDEFDKRFGYLLSVEERKKLGIKVSEEEDIY